MRFPAAVIVGSASFRNWPRSTKVSRMSCCTEIVVVDRREGLTEHGEIFHRFVDAIVFDVVACRFCAQDEVVANVLLDKAVSVMAADHRVG